MGEIRKERGKFSKSRRRKIRKINLKNLKTYQKGKTRCNNYLIKITCTDKFCISQR